MGLILCTLHGAQGATLVCPHLRETVATGASIDTAIELRLSGDALDGRVMLYPHCSSCLRSLGLTCLPTTDLDWDEWFERLTLEPVCGQCYKDTCLRG